MQRSTLGMGLCVVGMSSIVAFGRGTSAEPDPIALDDAVLGGTVVHSPLVELSKKPLVRPIAAEFAAFGISCSVVPPELVAHLGLAAGEGVLVHGVDPSSLAAESSLKTFDVIINVEGQPATMESLQGALGSGSGLAMGVVSGGVLRDLTLDGDPSSESEFLSVESLAPNHPMRRVGRLEALRERYAETTSKYKQRQRELDDEARKERQLASEQVEALLAESDERVRAYFDLRETQILTWLDGELAATRVEPLQELGLDLNAVITPERVKSLNQGLEALVSSLRDDVADRVDLDIDEEYPETGKRARKKLAGLASDHGSRIEQRIMRSLQSVQKDLQQNQERLTSGHQERVAWTDETISAIRAQVRERVECAFDRSAEIFHKRMSERLRNMDLPRAGEVEASLEDLSSEVEAWSQRFITRAQSDLRLFARALNERPEQLGRELLKEFERSEKALQVLLQGTNLALDTQLATRLTINGTWQSADAVKSTADALRFQLEEALLASRRIMGKSGAMLSSTLREEREQSSEAWQDLRKKLSRLLQEAGDNCWEIKGPHLDGRFPRKDQRVSMLR